MKAGRATPGRVVFVGAGPGQADLITVRGAQRLGQADVVLFDSLADPALRALAPKARWIFRPRRSASLKAKRFTIEAARRVMVRLGAATELPRGE